MFRELTKALIDVTDKKSYSTHRVVDTLRREIQEDLQAAFESGRPLVRAFPDAFSKSDCYVGFLLTISDVHLETGDVALDGSHRHDHCLNNLKRCREERDKFAEQLKTCQRELDSTKDRLENCERELEREKCDCLERSCGECTRFEKQIEVMKRIYDQQKDESERLKEKVDDLKKQLDDMLSNLKKFRNLNAIYKNEKDQLKTKVEEYESEREKFSQQLDRCHQEIKTCSNSIQDEKSFNDDLILQHELTTGLLGKGNLEKYKKIIAYYKTRLDECKTDLEKCETYMKQNDTTNELLKCKRTIKNEYGMENNMIVDDISAESKAHEYVLSCLEALGHTASDCNSLIMDAFTLQEMLTNPETGWQQLKRKLDDAERDRTDTQVQLNLCEKQRKEHEQTITDQQHSVDELNKQIEGLEKDRDELRRELEFIEHNVEEYMSKSSEKNIKKESTKDHVIALLNYVSRKMTQIETIDTLNEKLLEYENRIKKQENEIKMLECSTHLKEQTSDGTFTCNQWSENFNSKSSNTSNSSNSEVANANKQIASIQYTLHKNHLLTTLTGVESKNPDPVLAVQTLVDLLNEVLDHTQKVSVNLERFMKKEADEMEAESTLSFKMTKIEYDMNVMMLKFEQLEEERDKLLEKEKAAILEHRQTVEAINVRVREVEAEKSACEEEKEVLRASVEKYQREASGMLQIIEKGKEELRLCHLQTDTKCKTVLHQKNENLLCKIAELEKTTIPIADVIEMLKIKDVSSDHPDNNDQNLLSTIQKLKAIVGQCMKHVKLTETEYFDDNLESLQKKLKSLKEQTEMLEECRKALTTCQEERDEQVRIRTEYQNDLGLKTKQLNQSQLTLNASINEHKNQLADLEHQKNEEQQALICQLNQQIELNKTSQQQVSENYRQLTGYKEELKVQTEALEKSQIILDERERQQIVLQQELEACKELQTELNLLQLKLDTCERELIELRKQHDQERITWNEQRDFAEKHKNELQVCTPDDHRAPFVQDTLRTYQKNIENLRNMFYCFYKYHFMTVYRMEALHESVEPPHTVLENLLTQIQAQKTQNPEDSVDAVILQYFLGLISVADSTEIADRDVAIHGCAQMMEEIHRMAVETEAVIQKFCSRKRTLNETLDERSGRPIIIHVREIEGSRRPTKVHVREKDDDTSFGPIKEEILQRSVLRNKKNKFLYKQVKRAALQRSVLRNKNKKHLYKQVKRAAKVQRLSQKEKKVCTETSSRVPQQAPEGVDPGFQENTGILPRLELGDLKFRLGSYLPQQEPAEAILHQPEVATMLASSSPDQRSPKKDNKLKRKKSKETPYKRVTEHPEKEETP